MINSVDGKTIENLRKRKNVRLVYNTKDYIRYTSKPSYISQRIFKKYFAAIHEIKQFNHLINQPIYDLMFYN